LQVSGDGPLRRVLAAMVAAALLAWWTRAGYFGHELLAEIAVFAILAMSLDLLAGRAGLVSLGHAALFGTGAYLYAAATLRWGWPPGAALVGATLLSAAIALAVGAVATRVQGVFFIMITLAAGEMGHEFFFRNRSLGGDDGLGGIPRLDLGALGLDLEDPATFSLVLLALLALSYLLLARLLASPFGAVLNGLHANPQRLGALGLPVRRYQTAAFTLSGLIAGFAGTLAAQHTQYISPALLHWTTSGEVLVMVILGGLGTLIGPVLGAAVLVLLRHELSELTRYWGFWLGLFLVLVVMGGGRGLVGWAESAWRRVRHRRPDSAHG
jgi:branched-chain amino acid transport system permease protein